MGFLEARVCSHSSMIRNVSSLWRVGDNDNGAKRSVIDGPFAGTNELVAGFWIWEVKSIEEAVEWAKKCPNPMPGEESELEIRPYYEAADFGEGFTPEEQAREADLRKRIGDV